MACGQYFTGGSYVSSAQIWKEYTTGKQTYKQLSEKYKCSIKTIQRRIRFIWATKDDKNSERSHNFNGHNLLGKELWRNAF